MLPSRNSTPRSISTIGPAMLRGRRRRCHCGGGGGVVTGALAMRHLAFSRGRRGRRRRRPDMIVARPGELQHFDAACDDEIERPRPAPTPAGVFIQQAQDAGGDDHRRGHESCGTATHGSHVPTLLAVSYAPAAHTAKKHPNPDANHDEWPSTVQAEEPNI